MRNASITDQLLREDGRGGVDTSLGYREELLIERLQLFEEHSRLFLTFRASLPLPSEARGTEGALYAPATCSSAVRFGIVTVDPFSATR